ncbi:MAG: DUF883 family protein [Hylemonella sp.]|nr:DUF883 family protein [Hylemonella sp.]
MFETSAPQREKLMDDLRQVIADTEELLRMTADEVGDNVSEVRGRIQRRLQSARSQLAELQGTAAAAVKEAGHATDEYVHQNPWTSIGIGVAIGLLVGLVIDRRK